MFIKASIKMVNFMAGVGLFLILDQCSKVTMRRIRNVVMEEKSTQEVMFTLDNIRMADYGDKAP